MMGPKISFSLRAFIAYFLILGTLSWFIINNALERLNDGMRQSAESVMVDISHLLAASIEHKLQSTQYKSQIPTNEIARLFANIKSRRIQAEIHQISKAFVDMDLYITDSNGIVIYDSTGQHEGEDFSNWRDVHLTLKGEYGARTSFTDPTKTGEDDEKAMVVAAPIRHYNRIIGVVSVVKSINSLESHLEAESNLLKRSAISLVILAILAASILSWLLTRSLEKISTYARTMAQGDSIRQPTFLDQRLEDLSDSITHLRDQLDGKEYVEKYIHSLTHELKTPITSIQASAELLSEDLPVQEQHRFINNIRSSNSRMASLVERMLSLARLESGKHKLSVNEFDLKSEITKLTLERQLSLTSLNIELIIEPDTPYLVQGDKLLITQAVTNLLDNALSHSTEKGQIIIKLGMQELQVEANSPDHFAVSIFNQGGPIPDYALNKIFDRFFSLPAPEQPSDGSIRTRKSTGLGLSFVKQIMQLHHGRVKIENIKNGVLASLSWRII